MQKLTLEENEPAERPKSPDELLRGIAKRDDKIRDLGWQIVQEAWLNGQDLIHLKEQLGHGKYLLALKSVGMKPDRAARYMRLARGHQISDCQKFETIATALKAISKPRKEEVRGRSNRSRNHRRGENSRRQRNAFCEKMRSFNRLEMRKRRRRKSKRISRRHNRRSSSSKKRRESMKDFNAALPFSIMRRTKSRICVRRLRTKR